LSRFENEFEFRRQTPERSSRIHAGGYARLEEKLAMADRVIFVCILLLGGVYFYATEKLPSLEIGDPLGPKAFPRLLGVMLLVTALMLLMEMIRGRKRAPAAPGKKAEPADRGAYLILAAVVVWTFLYFLVFETLGFVIATTLYLFALMSYFHSGKWVTNALTAVLFCVGSYWMFKVLGVSLAQGILPF
jgi:putative tricarboxylic transport membrane protein